MEKLPEDFKQRWIAALRSGEYKQGKVFLYTESTDCYCVMGVAGKVLGINKSIMDGVCIPTDDRGFPKYLWISSPASEAVIMNDQGSSFLEIADYIEKNL